MQIGIIGLGRMGGNIARRLIRKGHQAMVLDRSPEAIAALAAEGASAVDSVGGLAAGLATPRVVCVMLPAGLATEETVGVLGNMLAPGDVIIDGGNSFYKDDIRRAAMLAVKGIHYIDVGTSRGIRGLERGYCMMIGGDRGVFKRLEPLFDALAPGYGAIERTKGRNAPDDRAERRYINTGPAGSGHIGKMVYNGIEYGLMQAYAEGFDILKTKAKAGLPDEPRFDLNLADIAEVWRRGSVVSSWLLDLVAMAFAGDVKLDRITGAVADSGEGRRAIDAAVEQSVPIPVLATTLFARFRSQSKTTYADRLPSAMR